MPTKILKCLLLALWAGFFIWLVVFGQIYLARLLHPKLWWLVVCGAAVLLLFLAVSCSKPATTSQEVPLSWRWPTFLILLVPLLYGIMLPTARFDAQTFARRSVQSPDGTTVQKTGIAEPTDEEAVEGGVSEVPLTRLNAETARYVGKGVEAVCQGIRDPQLPEDLMVCYRFLISCCAADARPVFIFVKKTDQAFPGNDTWVRVKGQLALYENSGFSIPMITAETLTPEKEPAFPFLF
jgi:putative membrane protein